MQQKKKTADKQQKQTSKTGSPETKRFRLYVTLGVVFGLTAGLYLLIGSAYQKVFFPGTIVNGINVSGLSPAEAQQAVSAAAGEYILTLVEKDENVEYIPGGDIGLYVADDTALQAILDSQNMFAWGAEAFYDKKYSLCIDYDEEKLRTAVDSLSCMDKGKWTAPKNAYIAYEKDTGYQIVPETAGSEILADALLDAVSEAVRNLSGSLSLADAGIYKAPKISSEDPALQKQFALLQSYSDMTVTYQFGSQTEVIDSGMISEWISVSESGRRTIDREAVTQYVKELAKKYNTAYSPKTLETSYGETVTIKNGFYGWMIDKEAEGNALMAILREGKSVTKEPAYIMEAASHAGPDYGDTYVEINLTAQHLFYYKDGELVIESDFVSGNPSRGNDTPGGAYSITYKERNATLKGQNYRTPVSYWMPFNGNIGMHDSTWRSTYGGSIYKSNGSHGCINLPPAVAETIFENIEQGIPVLCYHLSGTEQAYATNLSGDKVSSPSAAPKPEPEIPLLPENGMLPSDIQPPSETGTPAPDTQYTPDGGSAIPETQLPPDDGSVVIPETQLPQEGGVVPDV